LLSLFPEAEFFIITILPCDPRLSYKIIPPATENLLVSGIPKISLEGHKKVIARRILLELIRLFETKRSPVLVNLGIGIPALISLVAAEENVTDFIITVLESGPWGRTCTCRK
jgi:propionate CoA-transferase